MQTESNDLIHNYLHKINKSFQDNSELFGDIFINK